MKRLQNWIAGGLVAIGVLCFAAVLIVMDRSAGMMMPMPGMYMGMWLIPGMFLAILVFGIGVAAAQWLGYRRKDEFHHCPQCHESVRPQWHYCPYCGSRVDQ